MIKEIIWILMLCTSLSCADQRCLSCKMVPTPIDCQTVVQCGPNQECYARQYVTHAGIQLYDLGCIGKSMCSTTVGVLPSGFGKRYGYKTRLHKRQTSVLCTECCNTKDLCNMNGLCGSQNLTLPSGSTLCYNCNETRQIDDCREISLCNNRQACQVHSTKNAQGEVRWNHGCVPKQQCLDSSLPVNSCQTCCTNDLCNVNCTPSTTTATKISTKPTTVKQTTSTLKVTSEATLIKPTISVPSNQKCLSCTMVQTPSVCHTVSQCEQNEECYTKKYVTQKGNTLYDLGCINRSMCSISVGLLPSGFGKRNGYENSLHNRQATENCTECCDSKDLCNIDGLCGSQHQTPPAGYTLCYNCSDLRHTNDCQNISLCGNNQVCHVHSTKNIHGEIQWSYGCVPQQQCPDSSLPPESCQTCCTTDLCNVNCNELTPTSHMAYKSLQTTLTTKVTTEQTTRKSTTSVPLKKPHIVHLNIQPIQFHYGSSVMITCNATGNPAPHFNFMFKGILQSNTLVLGNKISINNFNYRNDGDYRCSATNKLGQDTKIIRLHGQGMKPIVQIHVNPTTTQYGSTVNITCDATGIPTPNIDLLFKNGTLPTNTKVNGHVITIRNFTINNNGYYHCTAKNIAGTDTKTIHIHGQGFKSKIIKIDIIPQDYEIGDNVNITCIATGYPKPEIHFLVMTTHVLPSNEHVIGNAIVINKFTLDNVKRYKCMASNTFGRDERQFQLHDPRVKPSIVKVMIQPQIYQFGDTVNVTCIATGNPKPNIYYMVMTRFGTPPNDKRQGSSIIISNFTSVNIGAYRCSASNSLGRDQKTFQLQSLQSKPSIVMISIQPMIFYFGDTVNVTCKATGNPRPNITYMVMTSFGTPSNDKVNGNSIIISNFTSENIGMYGCAASNTLGSDRRTFKVQPSQAKLPSNISIEINPTPVTYGSTINITCHASGEPDPNIDFQFKIKSNIPKNIISQGHTVIIANFSVANNGDYRCMASNLAGIASILARVEGPKIPPIIIEVLISPKTVHYNTTVTAQCITIGYPKPSIQLAFKGFVPANTVVGQDGITIHNFARSNNGVYRCEATNVLGTTTKIFEIHGS